MEVTGLGAKQITDDTTVTIPLVSSFSISNFSDSIINLIISDVPTAIAAFDPLLNVPGQFTMDGDGTFSNISVSLEFASKGQNGSAIFYYRAKTQNC